MNTTLQVRIDSKTKKSAAKILESLGLDLSSGIKIFLNQVLRSKGVPFPIMTENGFTQAQEKKLLAMTRENEKLLRAGKLKTYATWDEAKEAMLNE